MIDFDQLNADLKGDEGFRSYPYDDKTTQRLVKGSVVQGTVTFGHGLTFLTEEESAEILDMRAKKIAAQLVARLPWFNSLSEGRQRALTDMAYNLGVDGLLSFNTFISLMQSGQYPAAAADLKTTLWAGQVHDRATRIEALIVHG